MKNTKYDPGPWVRDGFNLSSIIRCVVSRGHPDAKHTSGDYEEVARCTSETWDADSMLIAAAPELFNALRALLACAELNQEAIEPETEKAIDRAYDALEACCGVSQ